MSSEHLSPEAFVDVLEGAPVDASWRQHLDECEQCRKELAELEQTMALVRGDVDASAPVSAGPRAKRTVPTWALSAAAVLIAAVGALWFVGDAGPGAPVAVESDELLPPVEEDEEFQLLRALSDSSDVELAEIAGPAFDGFELDPSPLTPGERQRFVQRLTEEMRSSL